MLFAHFFFFKSPLVDMVWNKKEKNRRYFLMFLTMQLSEIVLYFIQSRFLNSAQTPKHAKIVPGTISDDFVKQATSPIIFSVPPLTDDNFADLCTQH